MPRRFVFALALALAPASLAPQAFAQAPGTSDADALAEQVRRVGANPQDREALLTAAELSVRLDDLSAAGSFLARADKLYPSGGRGQAIRGAILVHSERPGEALRAFAQAEAMGWPTARYAADRGMAYDLVGDQPRAQREYRLALQNGGDEETRRRYALSLGISGRQREALAELTPQLQRNDRAGWRTRAFILAMGGDAAEASRIAQTMMPPGSAQGLRNFFAQLPSLPAVDRAFAVHFGEVRANPNRYADARMAPVLPPLPAEPAPVQVAAVAPAPAADSKRDRKKSKKVKREPIAVTYVPQPAPEPVLQPPAYQAPVQAHPPSSGRTGTIVAANTADRPLTPGEQASLAAATQRLPGRRTTRTTVAANTAAVAQPRATFTPTPSASLGSTPVVATATPRPTVSGTQPVVGSASPSTAASAVPSVAMTPSPSSAPGTVTPVPVAPLAPAPALAALPNSTPAGSVASSTAPSGTAPPGTVASSMAPIGATAAGATPDVSVPAAASLPATPATVVAPRLAPPARVAAAPARSGRLTREKADGILAKIVANLSIPAAELGVQEAAPGTKAPRGRRTDRAIANAADATDAPPAKTEARKTAAERKAAAAKKAAADKAATEKKELAAKAAAEKKAARAQPSRIWVQVAGGANAGDLDKAWSGARAKAPTAFAGRKGYTTKLRATNRVLTGPFKTDAEARAYVNQLAKKGVSAFAFTSEAGQKVDRLDAK